MPPPTLFGNSNDNQNYPFPHCTHKNTSPNPNAGTVRTFVLETSLWKLSAGFWASILETGWLARQFPRENTYGLRAARLVIYGRTLRPISPIQRETYVVRGIQNI